DDDLGFEVQRGQSTPHGCVRFGSSSRGPSHRHVTTRGTRLAVRAWNVSHRELALRVIAPRRLRSIRMAKPVLYHNPRCSKSRETLAVLEAPGVALDVVKYLEEPRSAAEVIDLAKKLGPDASRLVRTKEAAYAESGLTRESSVEEIAAAIAKAPVL